MALGHSVDLVVVVVLPHLNTTLTWHLGGRLVPVKQWQHLTTATAAVHVATVLVAPGNRVLVFAAKARSHRRKDFFGGGGIGPWMKSCCHCFGK